MLTVELNKVQAMPATVRSGVKKQSTKTAKRKTTSKKVSSSQAGRKPARSSKRENNLLVAFTHKHLTSAMVILALLLTIIVGYSATRSSLAATATGHVKGLAGKCLDNAQSPAKSGNRVHMYDCHSGKNQQWSVHNDGTLRVQGYCLDVKGASKAIGVLVQLYKCNGTVAQKWLIKSNGTIINPNSSLCLDVKNASTSNRATVWMYTCNGTAAQQWTTPRISAAPKPAPAPSPSPSPEPSPQPAPGGTPPSAGTQKLVWSDEFDGSSVDKSKWSVVNQLRSIESHHQGRYLTANTTVDGGYLKIATKRHCVKSGTLPSGSNESTAPCPSGASTQYSSGQVRSPYIWKSGKMEIRAKMPKTTQNGLWSGFWLRQQGTWCTSDYGELDILEWYSDPSSTDESTATTHLGCANERLTSRQHLATVSGSLADTWHTWGVKWDSKSVTYYLDGKVVRSITSHRPTDSNQDVDHVEDFAGLSESKFASIVNRPWHLRINTQVYPVNDRWHLAPDNKVNFTPQTMLVDYVRVYSL